MQAYHQALMHRHASLLRAVTDGTQVPISLSRRDPHDGGDSAAAELAHLRANAAARQQAVLAALASVRHAKGLIAQKVCPLSLLSPP